MRVIAGTARGRLLKGPRGAHVRPTADKVKGAMFSMIETQLARLFPERDDVWQDTRVLDLYAGSGALGIEGLSRGAAWADFVDQSESSIRLIRENLTRADVASRARVHRMRVEQALTTRGALRASYEVILVDAPYSDPSLPLVLRSVASSDLIADRAVIVVEHSRRQELPDGVGSFRRIRVKRYGDTIVSVYVSGSDEDATSFVDTGDDVDGHERDGTDNGPTDRSPPGGITERRRRGDTR